MQQIFPDAFDKAAVKFYVPEVYGSKTVQPHDLAEKMAGETLLHTAKSGNHVCRPDVCHKGWKGRKGFCRMDYWHWCKRRHSTTGEIVAVRSHGLPLQARWDRKEVPPFHAVPPVQGTPALEVNHPFHTKSSAAITLGPRCNHDLAFLYRMPVSVRHLSSSDLNSEHDWDDVTNFMSDTMSSQEYYISDYATKEQPHIEGLLHTLQDLYHYLQGLILNIKMR